MFLNKKNAALAVLCICLTMFFATGCSNKNDATPQTTPPPSNNMTTPTPAETPKTNADASNQADDKTANDKNLSAEAEKIATAIVDGVDEVEDAHVLISEHMAYAAIKIKSTADTAEAENIKKAVIEKAKATDSSLTDVYVSESADTFTRIGEIGEDIADGKPISGFMEELENMFVRVTPTK